MATLAQLILHTEDQSPENYVTNTFCTSGNVIDATESLALMNAFKAFYISLTPAVLSPSIAKLGHECKLYSAGGPKPNYPFYEGKWDLSAAPTGTMMPSEVAICLSFQGTRTAGLPQARRRGRVYIGPVQAGASNLGRPSSTVITALKNAAVSLATAIDAVPSAGVWSVWSPTDGTAVPITNGWVDNAWDTQRSRGIQRTARELYTV